MSSDVSRPRASDLCMSQAEGGTEVPADSAPFPSSAFECWNPKTRNHNPQQNLPQECNPNLMNLLSGEACFSPPLGSDPQ